jgi:hypothetical protein
MTATATNLVKEIWLDYFKGSQPANGVHSFSQALPLQGQFIHIFHSWTLFCQVSPKLVCKPPFAGCTFAVVACCSGRLL